MPFFYLETPTKFGLSPTSGVEGGGNAVTITGSNLNNATEVTFGANSATITGSTAGSIAVKVPAGTGTVPVTVLTPGGSTNGLFYTYVAAPAVTTITPDEGPTTGGTGVTITGTGLTTTTAVTFGGASASFVVVSPTEISAVTPAGTAGAVDVVVTTTGGSAPMTEGFTYVGASEI